MANMVSELNIGGDHERPKRKTAFDDEEKKDSESSGEADASDDDASDDDASDGSEYDTDSEGGEDAAASEGGEAAAAKAAAKAASAEAYFAGFENEKERNKEREYCRILEESDGFDLGKDPPKNHIGGRNEIDVKNFKDALLTECIDALIVVIKHRNEEKGENLEFVEVTKAIFTGCIHYWVTFIARNKTTGEVNSYQSQMYYNVSFGTVRVKLFRLKPSGDSTAIQA